MRSSIGSFRLFGTIKGQRRTQNSLALSRNRGQSLLSSSANKSTPGCIVRGWLGAQGVLFAFSRRYGRRKSRYARDPGEPEGHPAEPPRHSRPKRHIRAGASRRSQSGAPHARQPWHLPGAADGCASAATPALAPIRNESRSSRGVGGSTRHLNDGEVRLLVVWAVLAKNPFWPTCGPSSPQRDRSPVAPQYSQSPSNLSTAQHLPLRYGRISNYEI